MRTGICPICGKKVDKLIMFRGDVVGCRYCGIHTKQTNADRIRGMTDEELAELWWERVDCGECPVHRNCKMTGQDCKKLALEWLKQEVTGNDS